MRALVLKEIRGFFSSVTGYLVIAVYLLINSAFLWVFPGDFNVLDGGYASLDELFLISPWVFLFLVPALTMRLFADEKKAGTMELLLTKPVTDLQIIGAKYLAAIFLIFISLMPTLIYFLGCLSAREPRGQY